MIAEQVNDSRDTQILPGVRLGRDRAGQSARLPQPAGVVPPRPPVGDAGRHGLPPRPSAPGGMTERPARRGLTLAGVLMFGQGTAIEEALPNYLLDYQERPEDTSETRWTDRVVPRRHMVGEPVRLLPPRRPGGLVADLKVPVRASRATSGKTTRPRITLLREALWSTPWSTPTTATGRRFRS